MSRPRRMAVALAVTIAASFAMSAPVQAADFIVPFNNYKLSGSFGLKTLGQTITLPDGSTFNGAANITQGSLTGNTAIPEFTSTIRVLGIPTKVTTRLDEAEPVTGTVKLNPDGTVSVHASTSVTLNIRRLRILLLSLPSSCRTAEPVRLDLNYDGPFSQTLRFTGTTTIPRLTGCGLLLGPVLNALIAGPGNTYDLSLSPPAS